MEPDMDDKWFLVQYTTFLLQQDNPSLLGVAADIHVSSIYLDWATTGDTPKNWGWRVDCSELSWIVVEYFYGVDPLRHRLVPRNDRRNALQTFRSTIKWQIHRKVLGCFVLPFSNDPVRHNHSNMVNTTNTIAWWFRDARCNFLSWRWSGGSRLRKHLKHPNESRVVWRSIVWIIIAYW